MIVSVTCLRNEEDIVEAFVRYHCARVHRMVIADHDSEDGTPGILVRLRRSGLPVEIRHVGGEAFPQAGILTRLIRETAAQFLPDWVVPLDADEFVRGDLDRLAAVDAVVELPWQTYVPTPGDAPDGDPIRRIVHRRRWEEPQFSKVAIPRPVLSDPAFRLAEGSHAVERPAAATCVIDGLTLAHFPVRSEEQVRRKAANFARRALVPGMLPGQSYHLARLAEECRRRGTFSAEDLQHLAATYAATGPVDESLVHDPLGP
jgi:hypothetical protein